MEGTFHCIVFYTNWARGGRAFFTTKKRGRNTPAQKTLDPFQYLWGGSDIFPLSVFCSLLFRNSTCFGSLSPMIFSLEQLNWNQKFIWDGRPLSKKVKAIISPQSSRERDRSPKFRVRNFIVEHRRLLHRLSLGRFHQEHVSFCIDLGHRSYGTRTLLLVWGSTPQSCDLRGHTKSSRKGQKPLW